MQEKNNKNRALVRSMKTLGFSLLQIRLALMAANQIKLNSIQTHTLKTPLLSRTVHGICRRTDARQHIAGVLSLNPEEIF